MPLTIRPLDEKHFKRFTNITRLALMSSNDVIKRALYPEGVTPALLSFFEARDSRAYHEGTGNYFLGVFDTSISTDGENEDDSIIAVAHWILEDEQSYDEPFTKKQYPESFNSQAVAEFFQMENRERKTLMGRRKYLHLSLLGTDQKHERRGAGSMLVKWGLEKADKEGLECYLDATAIGRPLYERLGFRLEKVNTVDVTKYGLEGEGRICAMVRPPNSLPTNGHTNGYSNGH